MEENEKKRFICLSLMLTAFLLAACSEDLKAINAPEILIAHNEPLVTKESVETATF